MVKAGNDAIQTQRKICFWAFASSLGLAVFFTLFGEAAVAKGLLLGTCFSVINFILIAKSISMTLGKSRSRGGFIVFTSILSRFVIMAIPLIAAIKIGSINFIAVAIGLFSVQVVTLVDYIIVRPILGGK